MRANSSVTLWKWRRRTERAASGPPSASSASSADRPLFENSIENVGKSGTAAIATHPLCTNTRPSAVYIVCPSRHGVFKPRCSPLLLESSGRRKRRAKTTKNLWPQKTVTNNATRRNQGPSPLSGLECILNIAATKNCAGVQSYCTELILAHHDPGF